MSNFRFFYIFWDILDERKSNLGQECEKGGFHPSGAKMKELSLIYLDSIIDSKMRVLAQTTTFLPRLWFTNTIDEN